MPVCRCLLAFGVLAALWTCSECAAPGETAAQDAINAIGADISRVASSLGLQANALKNALLKDSTLKWNLQDRRLLFTCAGLWQGPAASPISTLDNTKTSSATPMLGLDSMVQPFTVTDVFSEFGIAEATDITGKKSKPLLHM
jgi:hypothetical protein